MEIRVRLPRVPSGLATNLVGLFGLIAMAFAVGGLTGNWWWTVLVGGFFAVGLVVLAGAQEAAAQRVANAATQEIPRIGAA